MTKFIFPFRTTVLRLLYACLTFIQRLSYVRFTFVLRPFVSVLRQIRYPRWALRRHHAKQILYQRLTKRSLYHNYELRSLCLNEFLCHTTSLCVARKIVLECWFLDVRHALERPFDYSRHVEE